MIPDSLDHAKANQYRFLKIKPPIAPSHSHYTRKKNILLARATPVHDLSSVVARQFAESIVAVYNRPLHYLCISQKETGF